MTRPALHIVGIPYFPGKVAGKLQQELPRATADSILILKPQQIAVVTSPPAGFIVIEGAPVSHTMIRLLGFGVPTIIISEQQACLLEQGRRVVLDGATGVLSDELTEQELKPVEVVAHHDKPVRSADGISVHLRASVRNSTAAQQAVAMGAEAIGLVRSEFFMPADGHVPDAGFYETAFADVCQAAVPLPVTLRLLDIAADKVPDWLSDTTVAGESLGLQGVRLYHRDPVRSVYQAQLAAIDALAKQYQIQILIPYLVRYEELQYWLADIRSHLTSSIKLGAMAETPASVLDIANWLNACDFIAIGCNDLMQCLFAADRDRGDLRNYLDPYAPFLYRLLQQVAVAAGNHLDRVQLCGVLSQLQGVLPILLGLGYRAFSVDAPFIPYLSQTISAISITEAEELATEVCDARETQQVLEILQLHPDVRQPFLA